MVLILMENIDLNTTIATLKNGLTTISPDAAFGVIADWQQQLQGTEISKLLEELKATLDGSSSRRAIAEILSELGAQTTSAAENASGDLAVKLTELGQLLAQAGASLP
ncbi:MAG: hypothetical protein HC895_12500 [Leptolyngbyaceae cyanobacterium SM1_3_5]|nr:hypothetical protein [Leptolyngbyaceae cyanobacterium SM1_3_5]